MDLWLEWVELAARRSRTLILGSRSEITRTNVEKREREREKKKETSGEKKREISLIFDRLCRGRRHCVVVAPFITYPVRLALSLVSSLIRSACLGRPSHRGPARQLTTRNIAVTPRRRVQRLCVGATSTITAPARSPHPKNAYAVEFRGSLLTLRPAESCAIADYLTRRIHITHKVHTPFANLRPVSSTNIQPSLYHIHAFHHPPFFLGTYPAIELETL